MQQVECEMENCSREHVLNLIEKRKAMELKYCEYNAILEQNNIGMDEPLVDQDDFPLANIDIYQVRNARHQIICLRNDLRNLTHEIEEKLHILHESARGETELTHCISVKPSFTEPVCKVIHVDPSSPADIAGIREGDLIVEIGSVNKSSYSDKTDVQTVIYNSIGQNINVKVKRGETLIASKLVPTVRNNGVPWVGFIIKDL